MLPDPSPRVGYVVKRYPRFSETFILNEILAHEEAGLDVEIFALGFPAETHFQELLAQVKAPVRYVTADALKAADFWQALREGAGCLPGLWSVLGEVSEEEHAARDVRLVWQAVRVAMACRARGITHLHAHFATSATTVARLAARLAGIPYTFTAHAKDIFHESVEPADLRLKLREAAAVVTVSDFNQAFLNEHYGSDAAGVRRVYNGLDLERFPYEAPENREPLIVGVGRLVEKKGFGTLVEACGLLRDQGVPFACRIAGAGELEADLRRTIGALGLEREVVLVGPKPQYEVIRLLQEAAVFAAPCVVGEDGNRDGLPTVLLEAMALGTPCVSTDVTGIPEVVRHEETGLVVPQHDAAALAAAMASLLHHPARRQRLSLQGRRLVEAEFDVRRNAARIRALFAGAVRRGQQSLVRVA